MLVKKPISNPLHSLGTSEDFSIVICIVTVHDSPGMVLELPLDLVEEIPGQTSKAVIEKLLRRT